MNPSFPLSKAYFVALFCEAILHGTRAHRPLSTVHIALSLRQNLIAFFAQHAAEGALSILNDQGNPIVYMQILIEVVNDSIVCWRAWVLWGRDYRVVIPPILCISGGLATGIGMVHAFAVSPPGQEVYDADITSWFLAFGVLTCISNIYCVVAISDARATFRNMRQYSRGMVIRGGKYHSALLIIVESGVLYCVVLIITVILFASDNNGVYVIADMLSHLTGIYPTVIIVLVSLKMTFYDDVARAQKTLTTFQAEAPSGEFRTTVDSRRRARGAVESGESGETESTYVLEPMSFAPRRSLDLRGAFPSNVSAKEDGLIC
ncbi:hypothetical protein BD310DRAFT_952553 [Dichomitus squalens]|uniref:Uncharacterized protein n=1 Tax=Dichomitus squalens TaxID=114155 RepID=A0A4Q9PGZ3_9APHY|nr:hypothetical protein BD310DRAFT_952553 [Dichomitus squalens]